MDLHSPSVSSSSSNGHSTSSILSVLAQERRDLEEELSALISVLESHNVDMSTPLITPDGFPRSDIDVAQVRITRTRIIRLRNDLKAVMSRIETTLYEHHASLKAKGSESANGNSVASSSKPKPNGIAFAVINTVVQHSPAYEAGLISGDKIVKFGSIDAGNHQRLARLATVVQENENMPIEITVIREIDEAQARAEVNLVLTPRQGWGGRGLLGCHISPL
ncbi:hypothetical protein V1517DRAFT_321635 [Lipomyces orientalis]|uniref:Uncharacterized protein n=1 Tax=Lipomyces orientalis TaxID=1233043 RepID=A0ACC3TQ49_9ASCO